MNRLIAVALLILFALLMMKLFLFDPEKKVTLSLQKIRIESEDEKYKLDIVGDFHNTFDNIAFRSISPKELESKDRFSWDKSQAKNSLIIGNLITTKTNELDTIQGVIVSNYPLDEFKIYFPAKLYITIVNEKGKIINHLPLKGTRFFYELKQTNDKSSWILTTSHSRH